MKKLRRYGFFFLLHHGARVFALGCYVTINELDHRKASRHERERRAVPGQEGALVRVAEADVDLALEVRRVRRFGTGGRVAGPDAGAIGTGGARPDAGTGTGTVGTAG